MKKYFGFVFALTMFGLTFISCDQNTDLLDFGIEGRGDEATEYPAAIDEYVATNYPDATIEEVELEDDGTYEVELSDGTELIFDADGNFLEEEMDDEDEDEDGDEDEGEVVTEYPTAIDEYVAANHPNATIVEVVLYDDGTYEVELSDGTELEFDTDGNFLEEEMDEDEGEVVTEYPAAIDEYVTANHPNETIVEVVLYGDGTYEVELSDGTELEFDANGEFIG